MTGSVGTEFIYEMATSVSDGNSDSSDSRLLLCAKEMNDKSGKRSRNRYLEKIGNLNPEKKPMQLQFPDDLDALED